MIKMKRERLSIDVLAEERKAVKVHAALRGQTIKEYVLESIKIHMAMDDENKDLLSMTNYPSAVLKKVWDNKEDSVYDNI